MTHLTAAAIPDRMVSPRRGEPRMARRQLKPVASKIEFGDFQTPVALARKVCAVVRRLGFAPRSIVEPTCGTGAFIKAAIQAFPTLTQVLGNDIHAEYVAQARAIAKPVGACVEIVCSDFFADEMERRVRELPDPLLIIGNPPWVTNAGLGVLGSGNVPRKSNLNRLRGIEAMTGASNFDISEWMLRRCLEWMNGRAGMLAVLCKTSVARKLLQHAWESGLRLGAASMYRIDAQRHFGAAVDACLFVVTTGARKPIGECKEYASLDDKDAARAFGWVDGAIVADVAKHQRWHWLDRGNKSITAGGGCATCATTTGLIKSENWRSGIKHDCSKVFELRHDGDGFVNGFGERVDVEDEVVYPLLKSSDLAGGRESRRWILVPQKSMSEDPSGLDARYPRAWEYLSEHGALLDRRGSSIYRNRARFSIFGVGNYSFAPWKVAISGLYKKLAFNAIGPVGGKPVMLDDTCYFYACASEEECVRVLRLLESDEARGFLESLIFWDAKRPITAGVLNRLDVERLGSLVAEKQRKAEGAEKS